MDEEVSSPDAAGDSLQALLDNMPDFIFFKDTDSRYTRVNHAYAAFVGLTDPDEVTGKTDADFFPEVEAREFLADEHHLLTTGEALIGKPESHPGADGQTRWVLTNKVPIRNGDGHITGLVGISRDITEHKAGGDALRRSEARFSSLIRNALDIITILDADGTVHFESSTVERALGYQPDELVGSNAFDLIHPDDLPAVYSAFLKTLDNPTLTPTVEFRVRHHDGSWRWLEATGTNLLADPAVGGVVVNSRDVTARKEAEDDLRASEWRHSELLAEARRQAQELALFDEVRTALARELELSDLFRTVVEGIARTFGYTLVSLYMLEDDVLVLQHQVGYDYQIQRISVTEGVSERAVRTGQPVLLEDVRNDRDFLGAVTGIVSELCVPLRNAGQVVGFLNVESRDGVRLTDADLRLMVALSEHVNVAIGRSRLYTEIRRSETRFSSLIRNALDIITILDADGTIRYESPAVERILGYQEDELVGINAFDQIHPHDRPSAYDAFIRILENPDFTSTVEFRFRHKDRSWRWLEATRTNLLADPAVGGVVVNSRDITERKELEGRLWHQAHHDSLTGLPNRTLFMHRLTQALSEREPGLVAVFFLDLDGFKVVNDSLGHEYGDRLLAAVSERLASRLRAGDLLARFGGDEFLVLQVHVTDASMAIGMAERLVEALTTPFALNGLEVSVSASVGVVLNSAELSTPTDLLRAADVALYRAKGKGKGGTAVFDATRDASTLAQLDQETALGHALERGELRLHYQPKVDLRTGRLLGVEALVRWQHPSDGLLPPAAFISLAEETGLIVPLGEWVLGEACRQVMAWHEQFPHAAILATGVNVSPVQIRHPDLVGQVERVLRETGLPPERLILEITEQGLVENTEATDRTVEALNALGVRLAIDDFGAYQAGLGYLLRWPMDILKLDRTLITDIDRDERSRAIVAAVVGLSHKLGMTVTAEGIETDEQLARLRELGCNWGQGYLFAPALPPGELAAFLERGAVCCFP